MNVGHFPPPKRRGLIVHGAIILVLTIIAIVAFINLSRADVGPAFLISLLALLLSFAPIPFLAYRAYSLWRADYHMDRDSLAINWGLRVEDIPLTDIEWMRPAEDLTNPLVLPSMPLPGGLLGVRRHPDLGVVEFLASDVHKLLLIATAKRVFAISPENPAALTQTFARATEMGSLSPAEAKSVYPSFVVTQAWESGLARARDDLRHPWAYQHLRPARTQERRDLLLLRCDKSNRTAGADARVYRRRWSRAAKRQGSIPTRRAARS